MKLNYSNLLIGFAVVLLVSISASAQEEATVIEGPDPSHREINFDEDKTLIYEHPSQSSAVTDSTVIPARVPFKVSKPEAQKENPRERNDEDALSFNFLYYMIQKFKLSDLIDQ